MARGSIPFNKSVSSTMKKAFTLPLEMKYSKEKGTKNFIFASAFLSSVVFCVLFFSTGENVELKHFTCFEKWLKTKYEKKMKKKRKNNNKETSLEIVRKEKNGNRFILNSYGDYNRDLMRTILNYIWMQEYFWIIIISRANTNFSPVNLSLL